MWNVNRYTRTQTACVASNWRVKMVFPEYIHVNDATEWNSMPAQSPYLFIWIKFNWMRVVLWIWCDGLAYSAISSRFRSLVGVSRWDFFFVRMFVSSPAIFSTNTVSLFIGWRKSHNSNRNRRSFRISYHDKTCCRVRHSQRLISCRSIICRVLWAMCMLHHMDQFPQPIANDIIVFIYVLLRSLVPPSNRINVIRITLFVDGNGHQIEPTTNHNKAHLASNFYFRFRCSSSSPSRRCNQTMHHTYKQWNKDILWNCIFSAVYVSFEQNRWRRRLIPPPTTVRRESIYDNRKQRCDGRRSV